MVELRNGLLCAALLSGSVFAGELYVSPSGNDKAAGTEKAPFATITRAAAAAKPGDTVKIGPGIYRERISFRRSGKKGAPVTFAGTRGKNGEFLTVVEAPGTNLAGWTPAPEIGPRVWKAPLAKRPDLVMMNGSMIAYINPLTMDLPRRKELPKELAEDAFWGKFGPGCKRLPGFDLMRLPPDIWVKHFLFGKRKEQFWPVIGNVLSGWYKGFLYVRFADERTPQENVFTATYGTGFTVWSSHLVFRDLHMRGSRVQIWIAKTSSDITVDSCLLMHGCCRVRIDAGASDVTVKNSILTAGFIRSDLFRLRSKEDMRGALLYLIFKYVIGTALSDDSGVRDWGTGTKICGNLFLQGLIGMDACGVDCEVSGNVVREMSSVGICTGATTVGRLHGNLLTNCGILLRIHDLRGKRAKREEYHYNNLFVQARHSGSHTYVHCESDRWGPDMVNFVKGTRTYRQDPPDPVDAGKIYIYHNTFWGGVDFGWERAFGVREYSQRFRMALPFFVFNNIFKDNPLLEVKTHEVPGPNLLYVFNTRAASVPRREPDVAKVNKVLTVESSRKVWNKNDLPGLPDLTLAPGSPALEAGVDVSKPFTLNGKNFPALPGFEPGYFKGRAPAAGALQGGESMENFIVLHRRAEAAIKMLNELKEKSAVEAKGNK